MIELTSLKYFLSAYETGTFSQAARLNKVSQPTISAAMQKLEDRLGSTLFQRSKSGLKPTPIAKQLYYDTVESVAHLSSLETRLAGQQQRTIRMHCAPDILLSPFTASLKGLRRDNNGLLLSFTEKRENSEIAFVSATCVPENHDFIPLKTENFGVALARYHPLATHDTLSLKDIHDEPLIHRPYCPNADRLDILWPNRPLSSAQAVHDQQLMELIAAGFGIAFVPFSHSKAQEDVVVLPITGYDTEMRTVGISHRRSAFASDLALKLAASHI